MSRDELIAAALDLSPSDRAALARRLLASLNDDELSSEGIEALWVAEAERRLDGVLSGRVTAIPAAEAWERVQKALG